MWQTGTRAIQRSLSTHVQGNDVHTLTTRASRFALANTGSLRHDGSCTIDVSSAMGGATSEELLASERRSGQFDLRWLERASLTNTDWLRDSKARTYKLSPTLIPPGAETLADAIKWNWERHGETRFFPGLDMTHVPHARRRAFSRFCLALVTNFPRILCQPSPPDAVTSFDRSVHAHHEWTLSTKESMLTHFEAGHLGHRLRVTTKDECERAASSHIGQSKARLHAHPRLTRIVLLWHGAERWRPRRAIIRREVCAQLTATGEVQRDSASGRGDHAELLCGLDLLEWRDVRHMTATNAYVAQPLFRLKANRFPLWNRAAEDLSCPHQHCSDTTTATLKHIFWGCPAAKRRWNTLTSAWEHLGLDLGDDARTWILGLELPEIPRHAWQTTTTRVTTTGRESELRQQLHKSVMLVWRAQVAEIIHGIWCERLQHIDDSTRDPLTSQAVAKATLRRALLRLRAISSQAGPREPPPGADEMRTALVASLLAHAEGPTLLSGPPQYTHSSFYLLYFDGGSRGNPGPGGSGSVIVRLSPTEHRTSIVWVASMAYGDCRNTNNVAEYRGLLHGLRHARRHNLTPLHVVGDSAIIINQQRHRRPPVSAKLRPLFMQSRVLADEIGVTSWIHHYREYNKMADKAANVAMDEKRSQQTKTPSDRDLMRSVEQHMTSDVSHWLDVAEQHQTTLSADR